MTLAEYIRPRRWAVWMGAPVEVQKRTAAVWCRADERDHGTEPPPERDPWDDCDRDRRIYD